jgi:hypothetical protein
VMLNLSELARTAIVFDNAYGVYPESIKGLFSILCSTYPAFGTAADVCRSPMPINSHSFVGRWIPHGRCSTLGASRQLSFLKSFSCTDSIFAAALPG